MKFNFYKKTKIFCIGRNKTGTTSLEKAAKDLGLKVGSQYDAELLFPFYIKRDFAPIIKYCKSAQFFQDVPFSLPYTYQILDYAFPESKFILTLRNSDEEWYNSLINFQTKIHGHDGKLPTIEDLKNSSRIFKGFAYLTKKEIFGTPDDDLYNKEMMIDHYNQYNKNVLHYFKNKNNLLVINISKPDSYHEFCSFIGEKPIYNEFPWENKTV